MFALAPLLYIVGILLSVLAVAMVLPALTDLAAGYGDWQAFLSAAGLTLFVGVSLILTCRRADPVLGVKQAFALTTLCWLALTAFAALPFLIGEHGMDFTDAFFEAMSGITTTGATTMVGLDEAPPGILIWRALLQWLGGIGIIVMAVAVMPMLRVGGMQLFRTESSDASEKMAPRAAQIAASIGAVYVLLSVIAAVAYWAAGMTGFDAVAHAMTTIATGGFSTRDASFAYFEAPAIEWIAIFFMIVGSLPFVLYLQMVRGRLLALVRDTQVQWFLGVLVVLVTIITLPLMASDGSNAVTAIRRAAFNGVSIITGTGYASEAFDRWGGFSVTIFFLIMFVGGCAGSTTCGIKIFRFQVLYAAATAHMARLLQPHRVSVPYYNRRPITDDIALSVMSFFYVYVLAFVGVAVALGMLGLDFRTAISGAASAISNVGPGLGPIIGPEGNYASLPDAAKWVLSAAMLLGRLELFTILVMFTPAFWRS